MNNQKLELLKKYKKLLTKENGNSMAPLIHSGQRHLLEECEWLDTKVGDIVYCKVGGRFFTHLVKAKTDDRGCQIGNNKGNINGWTKQVYGKVIQIL